MERFEKYLFGQLSFVKSMLELFSRSPSNDVAIFELRAQLDSLEDIIHHYKLFVKGETNDEIGQ